MYLQRAQDRVRTTGFPDQEEIHACTPDEVAALEDVVGAALPGAVREFLLWCGKGLGEIWSGNRCLEYDELLSQFGRDGAREVLAEAGLDATPLNEALVFQFDEDGQFAFVRLDEGDDPPVYCRNEGEPIRRCCDHFSDYVNLILDQEFGSPADALGGEGSPGNLPGGEDPSGPAASPHRSPDSPGMGGEQNIIPPGCQNEAALADAGSVDLPPSAREQLGICRASFKPSSANVLAGAIFGILLGGFGVVLSVWLVVLASGTGFHMPLMADHGISWFYFFLAELLSCGLAIDGLVMLRRLKRTAQEMVVLADHGLCLMRQSSYDVVPWSHVAEIHELIVQDHLPLKRVGRLVPAGKDQLYTLQLVDGRELRLNHTNVRHLSLFRAMLEQASKIHQIRWSTRESDAAIL